MARVMLDRESENLRPLKERLATIKDIHSAASVLAWDRQTYMPEGGVDGRAEQLASLARTAHEMLVSPETGRLLEDAGGSEHGSDDAALLRLARREHDRAVRLPARLVAETSRATALAEVAWARARTHSDWRIRGAYGSRLVEDLVEVRRAQPGSFPSGLSWLSPGSP